MSDAELLSVLKSIDSRLGGVEGRLERVESRMGALEMRIDGLEAQFSGLERRFDDLGTYVARQPDLRLVSHQMAALKTAAAISFWNKSFAR